MHSDKHPGLQQHSIGDLYPWSIVVYREKPGQGHLRPENLVSGHRGPPLRYHDAESFRLAHRWAEEWISNRIPRCQECHDRPAAEPHDCPYKADVHNDCLTLCNCCPECRKNCADDI